MSSFSSFSIRFLSFFFEIIFLYQFRARLFGVISWHSVSIFSFASSSRTPFLAPILQWMLRLTQIMLDEKTVGEASKISTIYIGQTKCSLFYPLYITWAIRIIPLARFSTLRKDLIVMIVLSIHSTSLYASNCAYTTTQLFRVVTLLFDDTINPPSDVYLELVTLHRLAVNFPIKIKTTTNGFFSVGEKRKGKWKKGGSEAAGGISTCRAFSPLCVRVLRRERRAVY